MLVSIPGICENSTSLDKIDFCCDLKILRIVLDYLSKPTILTRVFTRERGVGRRRYRDGSRSQRCSQSTNASSFHKLEKARNGFCPKPPEGT